MTAAVLRYATDVTAAEWALIAPHLPAPRALGRPRMTCLREVVNALFHMLWAGCPWRLIPREFPLACPYQSNTPLPVLS